MRGYDLKKRQTVRKRTGSRDFTNLSFFLDSWRLFFFPHFPHFMQNLVFKTPGFFYALNVLKSTSYP